MCGLDLQSLHAHWRPQKGQWARLPTSYCDEGYYSLWNIFTKGHDYSLSFHGKFTSNFCSLLLLYFLMLLTSDHDFCYCCFHVIISWKYFSWGVLVVSLIHDDQLVYLWRVCSRVHWRAKLVMPAGHAAEQVTFSRAGVCLLLLTSEAAGRWRDIYGTRKNAGSVSRLGFA